MLGNAKEAFYKKEGQAQAHSIWVSSTKISRILVSRMVKAPETLDLTSPIVQPNNMVLYVLSLC